MGRSHHGKAGSTQQDLSNRTIQVSIAEKICPVLILAGLIEAENDE
jgi:hypothetical protein